MSPPRPRNRPPLSPREAWISDGCHVLHFRPTLWDRWSQRLEVISGELLPDQSVPLLKRRWELSREEALRLWAEKRQQGWQVCAPQWERTRLRLEMSCDLRQAAEEWTIPQSISLQVSRWLVLRLLVLLPQRLLCQHHSQATSSCSPTVGRP